MLGLLMAGVTANNLRDTGMGAYCDKDCNTLVQGGNNCKDHNGGKVEGGNNVADNNCHDDVNVGGGVVTDNRLPND